MRTLSQPDPTEQEQLDAKLMREVAWVRAVDRAVAGYRRLVERPDDESPFQLPPSLREAS